MAHERSTAGGGDPLPACTVHHVHYYRADIADWWCENAQTVTDWCVPDPATDPLVAEAVAWLVDTFGDPGDLAECDVVNAIDQSYPGGWAGFVAGAGR